MKNINEDNDLSLESFQEISPDFDGSFGNTEFGTAQTVKKRNYSLIYALFLIGLLYLFFYIYDNMRIPVPAVVVNVPVEIRVKAPSEKIKFYDREMKPGVEYKIVSRHYDSGGSDRIVFCSLKLIHPENPMNLSWDMKNIDDIVYENLSNEYISIKKIDAKRIDKGYAIQWSFVLKDRWPETDKIDLAANVKDIDGLEYGYNDVLDCSIRFRK